MPANVLVLLLHIGGILKVVRDVEQDISDLAKKQPIASDLQATLADVVALISSGVISIPGVSQDQLAEVVKSLQAAL